jgi:tRNA-Thr(GGU) m(6)t(6)A37 methyltransferase TsaA
MKPIGIIHTDYTNLQDMPIQPVSANRSPGRIVLEEALLEGLTDLEGFSHLFLLYRFHRSNDYRLRVKPFLDDREHGVFATRAPRRPNPLGLSLVKLVAIRGNLIDFEGADMLDGTPLLDIKPYIPQFDRIDQASSGWLQASTAEIQGKRSDDRFI